MTVHRSKGATSQENKLTLGADAALARVFSGEGPEFSVIIRITRALALATSVTKLGRDTEICFCSIGF